MHATMMDMGTEHADTTYARRLAALIDHVGRGTAGFCALTGLDPGYVSKILSGSLGKSRELSKLHAATLGSLRLSGLYWSAPDDIPLEKALLHEPQQGGDMGKARADVGAGLARLARERGESAEMVADLLMSSPPPDADPVWWTRRYLDLHDLYGPASKD